MTDTLKTLNISCPLIFQENIFGQTSILNIINYAWPYLGLMSPNQDIGSQSSRSQKKKNKFPERLNLRLSRDMRCFRFCGYQSGQLSPDKILFDVSSTKLF